MTDIKIDISGVAETQRKLFNFSHKLGDRITKLALRSGANLMLKQARSAAPKRTGRLRRAIMVKNSRTNTVRRNGTVGVYITIRRAKKNGAFYGKWVEGGNKRMKGRFFIKNSFNSTKNEAVRLIVKNIENAGKQLAAKL